MADATPHRSSTWRRTLDFDGDHAPDEVSVAFTGGAHCCYELAVKLSASGRTIAIPFQLDGGYENGLDLDQPANFDVVTDSDGASAFVMRIASYAGRAQPIPLEWVRAYHVRSHRVRVTLRGGVLRADNLGWSCDEALAVLIARELRVWEGWPAACDYNELLAGLNATSAPGDDEMLGSAAVASRVDRIAPLLEGRHLTLAIYRRDDRIARIDLDEVALGGPTASLVEALGAPEARLPYTLWGFKHPDGQWVWPSRGLVVYVDPANRTIRHAGVFSPTDLATYKRELSWP